MLRQAFFGCSSKGSSAAARRWLTAATSSQKRALNPDQIRGASPQAPPLPPPPAAAPITFAASSGGGNSFLFAGGAVSLLAGAGAYYYYSTMNETKLLTQENTTELLDSVKSENGSSFTKESAPQESFPKSSEVPLQSSQAPILEKKTTTGNRVVSIAVPSKMKNSGTKRVAVTTPAHPEFGNRVSDLVPRSSESISEPPMDDTTMTVDAVEALRDSTSLAATEAVLKSHQSLWTAMDESFFHDLDSLTTAQLKARVMQLASELKDRTKWEAVRLKEFLAMKEKETADKYLEILQKQRLDFEDMLAKRLREQNNELSTRLNKALQEKEATIQSVLKTALEAQQHEHEADKKAFEEIVADEIRSALDEEYGKRLEEYKHHVTQDLQQKVTALNALRQKLQNLELALEASKSSKEGSLKAHRLSAAALALAEKLETNASAASELNALKIAAGNKGVIATACATIPAAIKVGVPTLPELQARFEKVNKKCRQAALVPPGRHGLEGQLAGMVFATLKYQPDADDPAPESDKDSAEYILVRARKHVHLGELEQAVEQLEQLTGLPEFTIADWKKDAINRIAVEKALKVIKMECALLNESCLEEE